MLESSKGMVTPSTVYYTLICPIASGVDTLPQSTRVGPPTTRNTQHALTSHSSWDVRLFEETAQCYVFTTLLSSLQACNRNIATPRDMGQKDKARRQLCYRETSGGDPLRSGS